MQQHQLIQHARCPCTAGISLHQQLQQRCRGRRNKLATATMASAGAAAGSMPQSLQPIVQGTCRLQMVSVCPSSGPTRRGEEWMLRA
jgi:hypothetical protein